MRDFFELVLQNIPATQIIAVLQALVARTSGVLSLECSAECALSEQLEQNVLNQILETESELALLLRLGQLHLNNITLEKPVLHLHKFDGQFEIDLSFIQPPGFGAAEVAELQKLAQELAQTYTIPAYFAGIQGGDEEDGENSQQRCYFSQAAD